jgi:hypothetical protein
MRNKQLLVLFFLILCVTSPLFSQIPPFKYITAKIYPKKYNGVWDLWVVSPIQESRIKKNGSVTEIQFRLVGANDWKAFDVDKIDLIQYELSAEPETCVLPKPAQSTPNLSGNSGSDWTYASGVPATVIFEGSSITVKTYDPGHGTPGPHYQITGTVTGTTITGSWKWVGTTTAFKGDRRFVEASCMGGQIKAEIAADGRSFRILEAGDPCGHGWKGLVFKKNL